MRPTSEGFPNSEIEPVLTPRGFPSSTPSVATVVLSKRFESSGLPLRKTLGCHFHCGGRLSLNRPRVLLADDHPAILEAEIALLSKHFEVVGTAANGQALVSEVRRLSPDLVVTDITMPILNGIDALQKLRESGSTVRFVFLTVHTEREFVEACTEVGALAYVNKSRMKEHLIPAIKAALAGQSYIP
jgi:CheY-like chemotaxis protein